ncbi:MAG: SDR family oxidoreductase [Acetobacteraceae bacterium]
MAQSPDTISPSIPRSALVTGGGKRLGRAIALTLAEAGFDVAVHCNASTRDAEDTAAEIRRLGRRAAVLPADLSAEAETATLIDRAAQGIGTLGVLVNNASTFERDEWHDVTRESWDLHIEPNLRAPFVLIQDFAKALPQTAEGVVINMLDQRVWSITPHFVSYTISKVGLWGLTQSLALALAPRIRVCGIGPGPALPNSRQTWEQFERQAASTPLRRGPAIEEIGEAVLAILRLRSMTGQMIALDGGQHMQWAHGQASPPDDE